jgi:glutathione S-transferase
MADYTLFTHPKTRGQIARWALHEAHAGYEQKLVNLMGQRPADFQAANPMGKVPTLIHHAPGGDRIITECAAICAYLADAQAAADLAPLDDERADYYRWLFFAAGPVEAAITVRSLGCEPTPEQQGFAGFGSFDRTVDTLEGHLKGCDFVCGSRFTMADVYVGSQVLWGLGFKTLPERPAFSAYAERMKQRMAYQAAKAIDEALIAKEPA